MNDTLNLVISGVTGRMGKVVARLAHLENTIKLAGGIASKNNPLLKRTFRDAWIADSDAVIYDIDSAHEVLSRADVVISHNTSCRNRKYFGHSQKWCKNSSWNNWLHSGATSPRSEERRVGKECRSRWS